MLKLPNFLHSRYMEEVRLSVLDTGRLYPPGDIPETHFERMNRPYGHSANGRIMSMKNSTFYTVGTWRQGCKS